MHLDKFNIDNWSKDLIELENINVNTQEFYKIIEIIKKALRNVGINPEGKQIFYQRNSDATSILAIQVTNGSDNDINNYMIVGCKSWQYVSDVNCDVYMHSQAKSSHKSMQLSNLISQEIVNFFEQIEKSLLKNNIFDLSMSLMIPLEIKKEESNNIKKIIKKLLKKYPR